MASQKLSAIRAVPAVPLDEALRQLTETGKPVVLQGPDGKDCAALVSMEALRRLTGETAGNEAKSAANAAGLPPGTPALAPDGLPWPEGYFDRPPRMTLEQAIAVHGVRPSRYYKGFPCYTQEDAGRPEFRSGLPEESPEDRAEWEAELAAWEAQKADREGTGVASADEKEA